MRSKSNKRPRRRSLGQRLRTALMLGVIVAMLVSAALILPWRWIAPPTTSFMLRDAAAAQRPVRYQWVDMARISPTLAISVVAAEDQKFPEHYGFDFESIAQALEDPGARKRGASTITQQLAKNLYLWPGRSLFRKGLEAWLSAWIELAWPKRRILEVYLNVVEFGPGIYGAHAASRAHFGRDPARLSPQQAALLAAVLPNPTSRSASRPSRYVRARARRIQRQVRNLGGPSYLPWLAQR